MAETVELASTIISIGISTEGLGKDILGTLKGVGGQIGGIGKTAGTQFKTGFSSSAAGAAKTAEVEAQKAASAVESAGRRVKAARTAEQAATRSVAIEEQKLTELRSSGNAKTSQIMAAEDRLEKARVKLALATDKAGVEARSLATAHDQQKAAALRAADATDKAATSASGFGAKLKAGIGKLNPFSGLSSQASTAGDQSASGFSSRMSSGMKSGVGKLGDIIKGGLIAGAAAAGITGAAAFFGSFVTAGSNAEQAVGGVTAIFKGASDQILNAAKGAAQSVGMSSSAYNTMATTLGAGLKNKGIKDFAGQTQNLIGLGADLAAQFGGSTADAVSAIGSLMRGESDPIEKYGVSINEAAIKAELAAKGQDKLTGSALEQAKAQARLTILMRQTSDAQGAFARETDTFAGQQQRATAQWDTLKEKIGMQFLPALTGAMRFINTTALPALEGLGAQAESMGPMFQPLLDAAKGVGNVLFNGDFTGGIFGIEEDSPIIGVLFALRDGFTGIWDAVQSMWTVVQPILLQVWDTIVTKWGELQPRVDSIFTTIGGIVTNAMSIVQSIIANAMSIVQSIIANVTGAIKLIWDVWGDEILAVIGILMDTMTGIFDGALKIIGGIFQAWAALLKGDTQGVSDGVQAIFGGMFDILKSVFTGAVDVLGQIWSGIKDSFAGPVNWVISNVINPFLEALNGLASTFGIELGLKPLDLMVTSSANGQSVRTAMGFADGGYTGPGGRLQPAGIVHAGEVVFSQSDVAAHGGPAVVDAFRRMRGFASGGIVPNAKGWAGVDTSLLQAIQAWAQASGYSGGVTGNGGYRSLADQQAAYLAGGNLAAKPGTSMHELGLALDINPWPTAAQAAMLAQFGLGQTVGGEPWHIGLLGGGSGSAMPAFDLGAMIDGILGPLTDGMKAGLGGGVMADMLMGLPKMLGDWALSKLQSLVASFVTATGGGGSMAGGVGAMVAEMAAQRGWTGNQLDALNWIIGKESGGNPNAQNPTSTAYGIFQFLDSTWSTVGARKTSDPAGQISAGLQYIAQRYGSPVGAQAFWQANGWYANGTKDARRGLAWVGERGPELVNFGGGERVWSHPESVLRVDQYEATMARIEDMLAKSVTTSVPALLGGGSDAYEADEDAMERAMRRAMSGGFSARFEGGGDYLANTVLARLYLTEQSSGEEG